MAADGLANVGILREHDDAEKDRDYASDAAQGDLDRPNDEPLQINSTTTPSSHSRST